MSNLELFAEHNSALPEKGSAGKAWNSGEWSEILVAATVLEKGEVYVQGRGLVEVEKVERRDCGILWTVEDGFLTVNGLRKAPVGDMRRQANGLRASICAAHASSWTSSCGVELLETMGISSPKAGAGKVDMHVFLKGIDPALAGCSVKSSACGYPSLLNASKAGRLLFQGNPSDMQTLLRHDKGSRIRLSESGWKSVVPLGAEHEKFRKNLGRDPATVLSLLVLAHHVFPNTMSLEEACEVIAEHPSMREIGEADDARRWISMIVGDSLQGMVPGSSFKPSNGDVCGGILTVVGSGQPYLVQMPNRASAQKEMLSSCMIDTPSHNKTGHRSIVLRDGEEVVGLVPQIRIRPPSAVSRTVAPRPSLDFHFQA